MKDNIPEFYKTAIYHAFHGVIDVRYPNIRGAQNNLFFVKTNECEYVAKLGSRDMVIKNCAAGRLFAANNIPVPDIKISTYDGKWIEAYPMIPGRTLFERIRSGMPESLVKRAYTDILTHFAAMEQIQTKQFATDSKARRIYDMAHENIKHTNGRVMASVMRTAAYMLNCGRRQNTGLYHTDITPKNVIVDEKGRLVSFLDLDGITLCNRHFAFAVLADKWTELGFDTRELFDKYEYISGRPLNRPRITTMLNIVHFGKYLMYHTRKHRWK